MRRTLAGLIAAALVAGGVYLWATDAGADAAGFSGILIRSGLVLGALWLAWAQVMRIAGGLSFPMVVLGVLSLLLVVRSGKLAAVVVPIWGAILAWQYATAKARGWFSLLETVAKRSAAPKRRSSGRTVEGKVRRRAPESPPEEP